MSWPTCPACGMDLKSEAPMRLGETLLYNLEYYCGSKGVVAANDSDVRLIHISARCATTVLRGKDAEHAADLVALRHDLEVAEKWIATALGALTGMLHRFESNHGVSAGSEFEHFISVVTKQSGYAARPVDSQHLEPAVEFDGNKTCCVLCGREAYICFDEPCRGRQESQGGSA